MIKATIEQARRYGRHYATTNREFDSLAVRSLMNKSTGHKLTNSELDILVMDAKVAYEGARKAESLTLDGFEAAHDVAQRNEDI